VPLNARQLQRDEDYASSRLGSAVYQVEFWRHLIPPDPEHPPEKYGYEKDSWLITAAESFDEISAWEGEHPGGRMVAIYLIIPETLRPKDCRGLVHLSGLDPTNPKHRTNPAFPSGA
jgi:hypothetical protein